MKEQKSPVNWILESLISNDESLIGLYKYIDSYLEFSQCLRIMKQIGSNQRIAENYDENLYELCQNILFPALEKFSIEKDESQQLSSDLLEQAGWVIEAQEEERVILSKDLLELEEKYNKNIDEQILNKSIWRNKGSILSRSLLASGRKPPLNFCQNDENE
ncbi:hypothetical protein TVAG_267130 [Trichomonas vaginalis G3]|uniref:Uncharacterized protein n=1 Tax=Trichomonas vaginalis (strain ATCC PRA-98 / G3) TaxID=412133 RepID=A2F551_TRIV3|nr:hypothetical protein TVAG_267130 [Trichomonas vaginalis G3]|eukprot:XP_001312874.1 hypothetical protein [Trichomonas vaginalis G3]